MKIPSAAGNIWFASMPIPNAIFCPSGIRFVCMTLLLPQIFIFSAEDLSNAWQGRPCKAGQRGIFCD